MQNATYSDFTGLVHQRYLGKRAPLEVVHERDPDRARDDEGGEQRHRNNHAERGPRGTYGRN